MNYLTHVLTYHNYKFPDQTGGKIWAPTGTFQGCPDRTGSNRNSNQTCWSPLVICCGDNATKRTIHKNMINMIILWKLVIIFLQAFFVFNIQEVIIEMMIIQQVLLSLLVCIKICDSKLKTWMAIPIETHSIHLISFIILHQNVRKCAFF